MITLHLTCGQENVKVEITQTELADILAALSGALGVRASIETTIAAPPELLKAAGDSRRAAVRRTLGWLRAQRKR